jgi:DNA adenine methylase
MQLYAVLAQVQGKVAISGYHCELMDRLYKGWNVHEEGAKKTHSVKTERSEVLWTNF